MLILFGDTPSLEKRDLNEATLGQEGVALYNGGPSPTGGHKGWLQ